MADEQEPNLEGLNLGGVIVGSPAQAKVYQGPDIPVRNSQVAGTNMSFQDMFRAMTYNANADMGGGRRRAESVPLSSIYTGSRYASSRPYEEPMLEEMYAKNQSGVSQLINGSLKMAGTFTAALAGTTAGFLYGIKEFRNTGKFSSLFDNEANRMADDFTKKLENVLPNYMSQNETDADWWSPDYLLTPNFVADGLLKNLGYTYGSIVGGKMWVKALNSVGIIDKLVKVGKGLEAAVAIERSMTAVPKLQRAAAFENTLNSLAQTYLKTPASKILKNSDRILTSVTGMYGEAGLESLNSSNEFKKNAIEEYINVYGETPTGDALRKIENYTNELGKFTWGFNALVLSGSNYIQLPKILNSSRRADKALINDVTQKTLGGAFAEVAPRTLVQKALSKTNTVLGLMLPEGIEEGTQFAIQTGVSDYFNRARRNQSDTKDFLENLNGALGNVFSYGINETLHTKEGMSNVILGALSGGIQQSGIVGMYQNKEGKTRVGFGKTGAIAESRERAVNTDSAILGLNKTNIKDALADQAKYIGIAIGSQKGRIASIEAGDVAGEKNFENDYALSYVMPRVKYGKTQTIYNELDNYASQATTEEGFQELVSEGIANSNESNFLERLSNLKAMTKQVDNTYDLLNDRYSNELNPQGKKNYTDDVIEKMVYATAKVANYDVRIPEVNDNLIKNGIVTADILESIITSNKPNREATAEAVRQINELKINDLPVLSEVKVGLKKELADLIRLSMERKDFIDEYDAMRSSPESFIIPSSFEFGESDEVPVTVEQEEGKKKKTITERKLQVGEEYSLSEPIRKEGNRLIVGPKITVLSQTLGGEYEVKLPNGEIDFMTPEEFKQFNISDIDSMDVEISDAIDTAIDKLLKTKKYSDISIPEGENKLDYINSLNNTQLVDDIIKDVEKQTKEYIKQKKEEENILKDETLEQELLDTLNNDSLFTRSNDQGEFEVNSKKSGEIAIAASVPSKKIPGYERSMQFLNKLSGLPNRAELQVVYITKNNEDKLIPGLIEHLAQKKASVKQETTVAAVVVKRADNGDIKLVDVNGEEVITDPLNSAIYQVMPLEDLKWSEEFGSESMIRKNQLSEEPALKKIYAKRREAMLKAEDLTLYNFEPSMGTLVKGDVGASVVAAALIKKSDLSNKNVLFIPTTGDVLEKGSTYFTNPLGMVFLDHPDGYVRLQNKQNSEEDAKTIYDVLVKLGTNVFKEKNANGLESLVLLNWLRSVTHWGSPKEGATPGKNSLWFEKDNTRTSDKFRLKGFNLDVSFKPTSLKTNKTQIMDALKSMYNNIDNSKLNYNESYEEILGVTPTDIKTKTWENYQTYLLSSEGRTPEQIPLVTMAAPVAPGEYNRSGIYMIMSGFNDASEMDAVNLAKKTAKGPKGKTSTFGFKVESTGETENLQYILDDAGNVEIVDSTTNDEIIDRLMDDTLTAKKFERRYEETVDENSSNIPLAELIKVVAKGVIEERIATRQGVETEEIGKSGKTADDIAAGLDAFILGKEATKPTPKKTAPAPKAPVVSDKKADIEKLGIKIETNEVEAIPFMTGEKTMIGNRTYRDEVGILTNEGRRIQGLINSLSDRIANNLASKLGWEKKEVSFTRMDSTVQTEMKWHDSKGNKGDNNNIAIAYIDGKYDAELAALEDGKPAKTKVETTPVAPTVATDLKKFRKNIMQKGGKTNLRIKLDQAVADFTSENWKEVEDFMKENFKTIPAFRLKNILQAIGGRQAWGAYEDGSVYIYENAEVGTAYHEIFHAVWDIFLTTEEKANIILEFRSRKGEYVDRIGKTIQYKTATVDEINEKLAEEYREHRLSGEFPAKPTEGMSWIRKFFIDLSNFINTLFTGNKAQTNTANLFKKMGTGYYANSYNPYQAQLQLAQPGIVDLDQAVLSGRAMFSLVSAGLTVSNINDIMQQMTYTTLIQARANTNEGLFSVEDLDRKELYDTLKNDIEQVVYGSALNWATETIQEDPSKQADVAPILANYKALRDTIFANWNDIVKKHEEEYLSSYSVKLTDEEANFRNEYTITGKGDEYNDSNQVDAFRKSSAAIKLLLATVPVLDQNGYNAVSSIGGVVLEPMGKVYTTLLNTLHNSVDINDMMEKLRILSLEQPQYSVVYSRLTNGLPNAIKDDYFKNIEDLSGLQLTSAFYKSFDLQNPEVKTTFILQNGDVSISDTTLANATDQIASEMESSIIKAIKIDKKFLVFNGRSFVHKKTKSGINEVDKETVGTIDNNIKFLKKLGVDVNKEKLEKQSDWNKRKFIDGVNGIKRSISDITAIREITSKSLNINTRLREVGEVIAAIQNPDFQTTFINLNGDLVQSFIGQNPLSMFHNVLKKSNKLSDLENTRYNYLLSGNDVFSQGSVIMSKIYDEEGNKKSNVDKYMTVGYTGGIFNELTNKKKGSSKVVYAERLIEELNLNLKGVYMNLVPGDASLGWLLSMGNHISATSIAINNDPIYAVFKEYIKAEINLSREHRTIPQIEGRKNTDLRFFKGILGEVLHNNIVVASEEKEGKEFKYTTDEVYGQFEERIKKASDKFLSDDITDRIKTYTANGLIKKDLFGDTYTAKGIQLPMKKNMPLDVLRNQLGAMSANYMINNIELHKLIYSDPYLYKDELKRIKSFSSPRQSSINSSLEWNAKANQIANQEYKNKKDIGYTDMTKDHLNSIVLEDNISINEALKYEQFKSTDGGGVITFKAYRKLAMRDGNWNPSKERQYQYDVAYEKDVKGLGMSKFERAVLKNGNPGITAAYTPIKPIVTGRKLNEKKYNDVMLDKFALYPFSFRILHQMNPESNAIKLYNKMQAADIDYAVYDSGRKVGSVNKVSLYNKENQFDTTPVAKKNITKVPFSIIGIQAEIPSKETGDVTRGSQVTKLVTLDFLDCGVPLDFMTGKNFDQRLAAWNALESEEAKLDASGIYTELKNNDNLLNELTNIGYEELLEGIGWDGKSGNLDLKKLGDFLYSQVIKGNTDENILKSIESLKLGNKDVEATPAYSQIRNTLYSIARDMFISPTMSGGLKVQIPSALLESGDIKKAMINGKEGLVSDVLNFYTNANGEVVAEIYAARWFESDKTDEELLEFFDTPEGQRILKGISFRIPTQKQNSIDVIKIAKFLPKEFGDSVVIPAGMVAKVGSDFDIDKLSIYLKNVIVDKKTGDIKLVPFKGIGKAARDTFNNLEDYKKSIQNAYIESMEKLVGHPANFDRLVKPNSAQPLKDLADKILKLKGKTKTNYSSITNMLKQTTMSGIRHAFVSGKYAIGISSTSQTNHSLNQRGMVVFDTNADFKPGDKYWLGNKKLSFEKFNSIKPYGQASYATLSRIFDANNEYEISDIIGMFTDGYVDISNGDWIMDLGATPEVAGTWLTLVKYGVPIDTVSVFMNQPIILDYLASLQAKGSTYLFSYTDVNNIKESKKYGVDKRSSLVKEAVLTNKGLEKTVNSIPADDKARGQQQFILDEFLKYAKMAEMNLRVTQSTNFDTTNINDPSLIYMMNEKIKQNGPDKGNTNGLNSGTKNILANSYIGNLYVKLLEITNIYGKVLISEKPDNSTALENNILSRYLGLSKDKFVEIARKALNSVFDYSTQVNSELNKSLGTLLIGEDSVARQMGDFINEIKEEGEDHPLANNLIIKSLRYTPSVKEGGADELKFVAKDNKSYDKNQIIYSFSELKDYLKNTDQEDLYKGLISFSIVQSGLINSPISFTQFIPYEDFIEYYQENINSLNSTTINTFGKVGAFERNNWTNPDLVAFKKAYYEVDEDDQARYNASRTLSTGYDSIQAAINNKDIPQLITIPRSDIVSRKDYIVFTWEEGSEDEKKQMKADGDLSYIRKGLFRKVIQPSTQTPLLSKGKGYVYKQINAWGDGIRANEYYDHARKSVFNNGFDPVENEVGDALIVNLYGLTQQSLKEDISFEEMEANWDNFNTLDENEPEDAPIENIEETSEETPESEEDIVPSQGYKGGFENTGKGTPQGDGKDKAMREVADSGFIGELDTTTGKESSSLTSFNIMSRGATVALTNLNKAIKQFPVIALKPTGTTVMLARNKELSNKPLTEKTKSQILSAKVMGKEFVVGDMPGVDSQFIDYLQEIGAKFTVYHTGTTPRIDISQSVNIKQEQGVSTKEMTYQTVYKIVDVTDVPMDAYGIALQYIGSGGKIDEDSLYKEVITRRDERLTPKKQTKEESRNRDYVSKNVKSIGRVAEDIWESLDEDIQDKLSDQDIKNALLDVVGSFNTRLEAAKEFVSKYSTQDDVDRAMKDPIKTPIEIAISAAKKAQVKKIVINGQAYTEKGNKLYKNDVEVINKRVNEIYAVRKEIQNQTIRVTTYGNKNYFVLSDDSIVASDKATLGQKVNVSEDVKEMILDKAIEYRKTC